jgi:hypothetical protein
LATITVFTDNSVPGLPCNWTVDTGCCTDWDTYSPELQQAAAEFAAVSVWAATGRRFGACLRTVRPCRREQDWSPAGWFWSYGTWVPYIFDGAWYNATSCGRFCKPRCEIYLAPPVSGIVSVRYSGSGLVSPAAYRVDDYQWLVRQDGNCWPEHNDYNKPVVGTYAPTDDSAWEVTYLQGLGVPDVLQRAAGMYACEYAKSCLGQACGLPQRVTSISRQGVSVTLADVDQLLENGLTGLVEVDAIIQRFNPYRLASRMKVVSPDVSPIRRTTWT